MRLWDLRTNICQGIMHVPGMPVASFDQQVCWDCASIACVCMVTD